MSDVPDMPVTDRGEIPPVVASRRYPQAIRNFVTYLDQPGGPDRFLVTANTQGGGTTTTDVTLDAAAVTRDVQTEIVSLETVIGIRPWTVPGTVDIGGSIRWLYNNKAAGRVDTRNEIPPAPPPSHNHVHAQSTGLNADDHPIYMRVDGTRHFSAAVLGKNGTAGNHLLTLGQVQPGGPLAGLTSSQVQAIIQGLINASSNNPCRGPDSRRWKMAGGVAQGYTDANGNLAFSIAAAKFNGILSFLFMKMPHAGTTAVNLSFTLSGDVLFAFDSSALSSGAVAELNSIALTLRSSPSGSVHVVGHTDSIGTYAYNLGLSQRRAASVMSYFSAHVGNSQLRYSSEGRSYSDPVAPNTLPNGADNPAGRALNRRVEISYVPDVRYAYQYMEDQLLLTSLTNSSAVVTFIEDVRVDKQALVSLCWLALGI